MEKDLAYYMGLDYFKVMIKYEDLGKCQVIYPELPGCAAWMDICGDEDFISKNVLRQWIMDAINDGYDIPEP